MADYTGVRNASCTYPQRPESSPGDDMVAYGAIPHVVALGAHVNLPSMGHARDCTLSDHIVTWGRFRALEGHVHDALRTPV